MSEYAKRNARKLDEAGNYYWRHVSAMTQEGLNSKADIAAELAYRDQRNDELQHLADDLAATVVRLARYLDTPNGNTLRAREAIDFLRRKGYLSPYRDTPTKEA